MPQVVVTIDGKTYRMACDEGQEQHLETLAARFDKSMQGLRGAFGAIGDQRLTVMTGISIMDELLDAERKLAEQEKEIASLSKLREEATDRIDRTEGDVTKRVEDTTKQILKIAEGLRKLRA